MAAPKKDRRKHFEKIAQGLPPAVPPPPPSAGPWLEEQVRQGLLQPQVLLDFQAQHGITAPAPSAPPPHASDEQGVVPLSVDTLDAEGKFARGALERSVGKNLWERVYAAFADTADVEELARLTGAEPEQVTYLLEKGVKRLGLPPIREHAVDYREVSARLAAIPPAAGKALSPLRHGEVQAAATDRATKEAATAQGALQSTMRSVDICLGYVSRLLEHSMQRDAFEMPEQISPALLERLSKIASNLARAADTAVRLSRFTAGEPDHIIGIEVAEVICHMNEIELRDYLASGQLPAHLRKAGATGSSAPIDVEFNTCPTKP